MSFIQEYKNNFYIDKKNLFYQNKNLNHNSLFEHPKDILNKKKNTKSVIIYSSSSEDEEYIYNDYEYDGGKKENKKSTKNLSKKKTSKIRKEKMSVLPTFINTIKGKIIYNNQTKLELEEIKPKDTEDIILGTIIDLKYIKTEINNKTDLLNYFKTYDVLPLFFNYENKNVINKNKKNSFFSPTSQLLFLTFKIKNEYNFYKEIIENSPYSNFKDVSKILKEKKYIIAHFIYENYYMFLDNKKHKYEINECYVINEKYDFVKQNLSSINPVDLSEKIFLDDFIEILKKSKTYLTEFF